MKTLWLLLLLLAFAPAATGASTSVKTVNVRHRDPGCHWYVKSGSSKYLKRLSIKGPVKLVNQDIATQIVKGPGGTKRVKPGKSVVLRRKGTYRETMVRQMPKMDNHLTLIVR